MNKQQGAWAPPKITHHTGVREDMIRVLCNVVLSDLSIRDEVFNGQSEISDYSFMCEMRYA